MKIQPETISVLLPVYNAEKWLKSCVQSLLAQTFEDFRIYVINDGSTDQSLDILREFNDLRIIIVENKKNLGLIASLNEGLSLARGKYIARMDADDLCMPDRFKKQVEYLEAHPEVSVLGTRAYYLDEESHVVYKIPYPKDGVGSHLTYRNCLIHPSIMMRALTVGDQRYSNTALGFEDYDLWTRLSTQGLNIEILPQELLYYRVRQGSESAIRPHVLKLSVIKKIHLLSFLARVKFFRILPIETFLELHKHETFLRKYISDFKPRLDVYYRRLLK
jgi:glycosyltransferase involved in cell wall biosynthesis